MGNIFNKVCCTENNSTYTKQTSDMNYNYNHTDGSNTYTEPPSPKILTLIESNNDQSRNGMFSSSNTLCPQNKNDIGDMYIKVKNIGKGLFGNVIKIMHKKTAVIHSMKVIPKTNCKDIYTQTEIQNELNTITKLTHPYIIKTISLDDDNDNYYIINEYCNEGDLSEKLLSSTYFDEHVVRDIMFQIFTALLYLHSHNIIHGDLKLENILIKSISTNNEQQHTTYNIKLIDYGYSKLFSQNKKQIEDSISTTVYCSPEILINNYDEASDVWACGVIMYLLLSGEFPFLGDTESETTSKILKGEFSFDSTRFNDISMESKHLITQCLTFNKLKRISIKDALKHDFFMKGSNTYTNVFHTDIKNIKYVMKAVMKVKDGNVLYNAVVNYLLDNYDNHNEIDLINKTFLSVDCDMDGMISKDEFIKAVERCKFKSTSQDDVDRIFEKNDINKSGYIEYDEFCRNALANMEGLLCESNLKKAFDMFNLNKNDVITLNELIDVIGIDTCDDDNNNDYNTLKQTVFTNGIEGITFEHFKEIMLGV
jgi:calcium-dependent protein kinase